ncbi:MAG: arginine--tRNA ligase [Bacteroidota bacterium]
MPQHLLLPLIQTALQNNFQFQAAESQLQFQETRKEFTGDLTLVVFPLTKPAGKSPEQIGEAIGTYLLEHSPLVKSFNQVKGFLNIELHEGFWLSHFNEHLANPTFGSAGASNGRTVMVEYSSPNTNKPLHLGHLRNIFLGYSVAEILKASGSTVKKVQIINDRGIHICKSMVAWQKFGNGETPQSSGLKGDKLVGKYYVEFDKHYKAEIAELVAGGMEKEEAEKKAPIFLEAQAMLLEWEAEHLKGEGPVLALWNTMNGWVYEGFDRTYASMKVDFDTLYYESNTYLLGKEEVLKGVESGVFFKKDDGSVWVDLTADGLDEKLLLRSDGTAVYITQDIGTAILRYRDQPDLNQLIYTVGNEQDYHFKVLFLILQKLGFEWAKECYHLSYGMVDLPSGKMKSREGTVVDADDLIEEMRQNAQDISEELGKLDDASETEKMELYKLLGLGALKYYLLKVDPKKRMLFNPEESIDFAGHTGPFIQYTHARICSILRKAGSVVTVVNASIAINPSEKELVKRLAQYPGIVQEAAKNISPAVVANYVYELTKDFNHFYQTVPILKEENTELMQFRVAVSSLTERVIKSGMALLGIEVPERM